MFSHRNAALSALSAVGVVLCGVVNLAHAADQFLPLKAPPLQPAPALPSWTYGVMFGGDFAGHTGVNSTSGFYHGGYDGFAGIYGGLSADIPFARTGSQAVTFQSWIWSVDPVVDVMHSSGLHYSGTGGGFPVTGSGSLSQFDFLLLLKATTPLTPTSNLAFFGGLGGASLHPGGQPTGPGGPSYRGDAVVPAFRAGVEVSQQFNGALAVALQAFYQHTGGATFDTSLAGEGFEVKGNGSFMLGLTLNFGGNTTPPGGIRIPAARLSARSKPRHMLQRSIRRRAGARR